MSGKFDKHRADQRWLSSVSLDPRFGYVWRRRDAETRPAGPRSQGGGRSAGKSAPRKNCKKPLETAI